MTRPALLPLPSRWRRAGPRALLAGLAAGFGLAVLLSACGGDVGTGGTGVAPASYASGRISGFGSVIVNGVHFDETSATIVDDDGRPRTAADLRLGMTVSIDAGPVTTDATGIPRATAKVLHVGADLAGPVTSVDPATGTLVMLGQTVTIGSATVFDGYATGLAGVQAGDVVEVFAFLDATSGRYRATRVEKEDRLLTWTLQGVVATVDAANQRFTVGGATIEDGAVPGLPALSPGLRVRATLAPAASGTVYAATQVVVVQAPVLSQDEDSDVEGLVDGFQSLANFQVDGVPVDASGPGVVFLNGTAAGVANGVRVEVEGTVRNGVLVATQVDLRQDDSQEAAVEITGQITAVDTTAHTFTLRGQVVTWDASTAFSGGTAAGLVVGATVAMHGVLATNGSTVLATEIDLGH